MVMPINFLSPASSSLLWKRNTEGCSNRYDNKRRGEKLSEESLEKRKTKQNHEEKPNRKWEVQLCSCKEAFGCFTMHSSSGVALYHWSGALLSFGLILHQTCELEVPYLPARHVRVCVLMLMQSAQTQKKFCLFLCVHIYLGKREIWFYSIPWRKREEHELISEV